jgi:HPt (histidine-containing phosphotransfer) domain-containing protein
MTLPHQPHEILDVSQVLGISRGNLALARELVQEFLVMLPQEQTHIEKAYAAQDLDSVRQGAHRLVSGGHYTGFLRISNAARELEQGIIEGVSQEDITSAMADLRQEIQMALELPGKSFLVLLS